MELLTYGSSMKAFLRYCKPLSRVEKKNILQRNILKKIYLALHFCAKKISGLFAWVEKKFLHGRNLPTPPSKIKWFAPNKNHILASFAHENGCIRVLIATIAYGMGIDYKAVKTIVHYGIFTRKWMSW